MAGALAPEAGLWVLQTEIDPVLDVVGRSLASFGLPVVGIVPPGTEPTRAQGYARWLELDRRQSAAVPLVDALLDRACAVLGCGLSDATSDRLGLVQAQASLAEETVSSVLAGVSLPGLEEPPLRSPALAVLAGQSLALAVLAELRLAPDQRASEPLCCDVVGVVAELLGDAGGLRQAIPPVGRFRTADVDIVLNAGSDDAFGSLLQLMNREDVLDDFRYKTEAARIHNREALHALVVSMLAEEGAEVWLERLSRFGIAACRLPECEIAEVDRLQKMNAEIAMELGFRPEKIASWQQRRIIGSDGIEAAVPIA